LADNFRYAYRMATESDKKSVLVSAAETLGAAVGAVASLVGATAERKISTKIPRPAKLVKKNKSRLPRLEKKALKAEAKRKAQAPALSL
jgi:hypothetical protein